MGGIIEGVGDFISDPTGAKAAGRAAEMQAGAAGQANQTQKYIFDETRKDNAPWQDAGRTALGGLADKDFSRDFTMNDYQADPGFAFRMAEGEKAIERSAAARGGLNSGATLKALTKYSQGVASDEFNNAYNRFNADRDRRFNRLSSIAGVGQTANSQIAQAGQTYANAYGQNVMSAANARGAAEMAGGNNLRQMAGTAAGMYAMSDVRLKKNIVKLKDSHFKDVPTYEFEFKDPKFGEGKLIGVLAQDLLAIDPKHPAVKETKDGYAVNYSLLEVA